MTTTMLKQKQIAGFLLLFIGLIQPNFAIADEEKQEAPATTVKPALPELPIPTKNYKSFYASAQMDFAIDLDSIAIQPSEENEVRYILKATSKQGAVNVSYEGIRCDTHQKIIYAIGMADGSWHRSRKSEWSPINKTGNHLQQTFLAKDYFCVGTTLSGSVEAMRNRIKWNKPLNAYGN